MNTRKIKNAVLGGLAGIVLSTQLSGCGNPEVPAGYEAYVVSKPFAFGTEGFVEVVKGPRMYGVSWQKFLTLLDVRPKTYSEQFELLAKDDLTLTFAVHAKIKVTEGKTKDVIEGYGENWYEQSVKEQFRTYVRDAVQKYDGTKAKENMNNIRDEIKTNLATLTKSTPFEVMDVVVGNIQYPTTVTKSVEEKLATSQELERRTTQLEIAKKEAEIRVEEAKGLAQAQGIINATLTSQYLQHEAIEAAKSLAGSKNTTFYFIPTNPNGMGLPLVLETPKPSGEEGK